MSKKLIGALVAAVIVQCGFAEKQTGDITAAIRGAGLTPTYSVTVDGVSEGLSQYGDQSIVFDGEYNSSVWQNIFFLR